MNAKTKIEGLAVLVLGSFGVIASDKSESLPIMILSCVWMLFGCAIMMLGYLNDDRGEE